MEIKDLEKKLEEIKTPEIELKGHKRWLRLALLNSGYFKERTMNPIMYWTKRLVPAGVVLALILVLGFIVIQPKLQVARAMEIAKNDPQIQQLMKDYGVEIKEVKLQDGKAFVLLALPEEKLPPLPALKGDEKTGMRGRGQFYIAYRDPKTGEVRESSGSVAEIDLKGKKVEKLEMVEKTKIDIAPLTEEEKARAIEIVKSDPKMKEMLPKDAKVVAVKPLPPLKLRLDKDPDNGMKVVPADPNEEKRANVIFKSDEYQDIITVNLTIGKVEGAVSHSTGRIEKPESENPPFIKPHPIKPKLYLEEVEEGSLTANQKEIFSQMLKEISEKDDRIKDLLKDNDYEILDIIKSKPTVEKTETSELARVETITVVLKKKSTDEKYWITIDLASNTVKSIEKE